MRCLNKSLPQISELLKEFKEPVLAKILDSYEDEDYIPTKEEALKRYNELLENPTILSAKVYQNNASFNNGFLKEVGLNKKELDVSRQAEINRRVKLYNNKNNSHYYVKWSQVGQSNLYRWEVQDLSAKHSKSNLDGNSIKFSKIIENEMGEDYWKEIYTKSNLKNREDFENINIPTVKNKFKPDLHNVYHGTNKYQIDNEGNLILTPSNNFDNKTTSISFTQIPVVAQDYMLRKQGNVIIKIKNEALGSNYEIESPEEIAVNGNSLLIIPKEQYEIINVPTLAEKMKSKYSFEVLQIANEIKERAKSELDILDAYFSIAINADNFGELQEHDEFGTNEMAPDWYVPQEYLESRAAKKLFDEIKSKIDKNWIINELSNYLLEKIRNTGKPISDFTKEIEKLSEYGCKMCPHQSSLWEELLYVAGAKSFSERNEIIKAIEKIVKEREKSEIEFYNSEEQISRRLEKQKLEDEINRKFLESSKNNNFDIDDLPFTKILQNSNKVNLDYDLKKQDYFGETTSVKQGVDFVFEQNPELANAVYEALGFRKNIQFGEEDAAKINDFKNDKNTTVINVNNILNKETDPVTKELIKALTPYLNKNTKIYYQDGYIFKGSSELTLESSYAATIDGKGNILVFNKDYLNTDVVLHELMHDFLLDAINVNKDEVLINELTRIFNKAKTDTDLVERYSYAFSNLDEFVSEVFGNKGFRQELSYVEDYNLNKTSNIFQSVSNAIKDFLKRIFNFEISNTLLDSIFNAIESSVKNKNQITPEQKQQALQLYSQYLDTVFPDSKVKDIVYHVTTENFEVFSKEKQITGGFYFTESFPRYKGIIGKGKEERVMSALINSNNPLDEDTDFISETINNREHLEGFKQEGFDSIIDRGGNDEIIVFEPEQIHILGSKQDINEFKNWVENHKEKKEVKSSELLKKIANKDTPLGRIAIEFLKHIHKNDVNILLLTEEEAEQYLKDNKGKSRVALNESGGFYFPNKNEIVIIDKPSNNLDTYILHEIGHALSYDVLRNNPELKADFERLRKTAKSFFTKEEQKKFDYELSDFDEFFSALVRPSFLKALDSKPSMTGETSSLWEDIKNILRKLVNAIFGNSPTLADDYMNLIDRILNVEQFPIENIENDEILAARNIANEVEYVSDEDVENSIKELEKLETKGLSEKVNEFFTLIASHNKRLSFTKYAEINKIFDDPFIGNDFKVLFEQIRDAVQRGEEGIELEKKIRGFALSLQQLDYVIGKMDKHVRDADLSNLTDKEALIYISNYLQFIGDWQHSITNLKDAFNDSRDLRRLLGEISENLNSLEKSLRKKSQYAVINEVVNTLAAPQEKIKKEYEERVAKINNKIAKLKDPSDIAKAQAKLAKVEKQYKEESVERQQIIDYLEGKKGDANILSYFLQAAIESGDPIVAFAEKYLKQSYDDDLQDTRDYSADFLLTIKPLLEKLGYNKNKPFEFFKQLTQSTPKPNYKGEVQNHLELMNAVKGDWKVVLNDFADKIEQAKKDNDTTLEQELRTKLAKFKREYMYQEYTDEYYDKFEVWNDELGKEALAERRTLRAEMQLLENQEIKLNLRGEQLPLEDELHLEELKRKYKRLSATTDLNGKELDPNSIAYKKALKHKEYSEKGRKFIEFKEKKGKFERDRDRYKQELIAEGISKDSDEFNQKLAEWDNENTIQIATEDFYKKRQALINKIKGWTNRSTAPQIKEIGDKIQKNYEKINDILKGFKDESGIPEGNLLVDSQLDEIKLLEEENEKLRKSFNTFTGLTIEQQERFSDLILKKTTQGLTVAEEQELDELKDISNDLGLSKDLKKKVLEAIEELNEMQARIPSEYYVDVFNNIANKYGVEIDQSGFVNNNGNLQPILESPLLDKLLEHEDFKEWFDRSHMQVLRFNPETKQMEEKWQRTYAWSRIIPTKKEDFVHTTLKDGTSIQGKPISKYFYFDVKDEYKTGYNPKTKEVELEVGKHVDNRGNWLPKTYNDKGELIAADKTYVNDEYFDLKKANNDKWKLLEYLTKEHLKNQEGLPWSDRLYLEIPRFEKELQEIVRTEGLKGLKQHFLDKIFFWNNSAIIDQEGENFKEIPVKSDLFGQELITIPIKGIGKLDEKDVSLDIPKLLIQYRLSANRKKHLTEQHPLVDTLIKMLEANGHYKPDAVKKYTFKFLNYVRATSGQAPLEEKFELVKSKDPYRRVQILRNLEDKWLKGVYKRGFITGDRGPISIFLDKLISGLLRILGFGALAFKYSGAAVNSIAGNGYSLMESISGRNFTFGNYIAAQREYFTKVIPQLMSDGMEKLNTKSFYGQFLDVIDPQQELNHHVADRFTSSALFTGLGFLKDAFVNPRKFGEHQISVTIALAMARNMLVPYKGGQISLVDAYEIVDGKIQLKEGVELSKSKLSEYKEQIRQAIRETQGNYAKIDKTEAEKYGIGQIFFFMRKFFVPLFMDSFGTRRFNVNRGYSESYHSLFFKLALEGIKDRSLNWYSLTDVERKTIFKGLAFYGVSLLMYALIRFLDPDDKKESYNTTKHWDYSKLLALLLAIRTKSELEQFTIIGGRDEFAKFVNSPLSVGKKLSQANNSVNVIFDGIFGKDINYSSKGGYDTMMKDIFGTKNKLAIGVMKFFGYSGKLRGFIPGSKESKQQAAYRLKITSSMQRKPY